jgi:hypothetical protein
VDHAPHRCSQPIVPDFAVFCRQSLGTSHKKFHLEFYMLMCTIRRQGADQVPSGAGDFDSAAIDPRQLDGEFNLHFAKDYSMDPNRPLVFACSGCSNAGQLANQVALELNRRGVAEMSCLATSAAKGAVELRCGVLERRGPPGYVHGLYPPAR